MPQNRSYYFPVGLPWKYQDYTAHSSALLGSGPFSPNTIAVVLPDEGVNFNGVGAGAHSLDPQIRGVRNMVTLAPGDYDESYAILLHEIGHCFGSPDLYPISGTIHQVGGYRMMADARGARNFQGWHLFDTGGSLKTGPNS